LDYKAKKLPMKRGFMKITLILIMLVSNFAFAKIPDGCMDNLERAVTRHNEFESKVEDYLARGELTEKELNLLRSSHKSVAEVVALLCAGLRKIELQRTPFGRIGLVSQKKAEREAQKSYDAAMKYYMTLTARY
jgi:hypothetical protein